MNVSTRLRSMSRATRVGIVLALALPVFWWITGEAAGALLLWSGLVLITVVPMLVVAAVYPSQDGVSALERTHPQFGRAYWLDLAVTLLVAVLFVGGYYLLS